MDFFNSFLNFIINPKVKLGPKAATLISIILLLFLADNILGFSHFYNLNSKLEVVEKVASIRKDTSLTISDKQELLHIQKTALNRKTLKDKVYDFFFTSNKAPEVSFKDKTINDNDRNRIIHFITSALVMIIFFFYHSYQNGTEKEKTWSERIGAVLALFIIFGVLSLILSFLFSLIPPILGNYWYNYACQIAINIIWILIEIKKMRERSKQWDERLNHNLNLMRKAQTGTYTSTTNGQSSSKGT